MNPGLWIPLVVAALWTVVPRSATAQWMPVVAKQRTLEYRIKSDSSQELLKESRGTYYRSSSGSVIRTLFPISRGQRLGKGRSIFIDSETGKTYSLNHDRKTAAESPRQLPLPLTPDPRNGLEEKHVVGSGNINGVECIALKCYSGSFDQVIPGKSWVNVPYDLGIKSDCRPWPNLRKVTELYDIEFKEPDESHFGIPEGYTMIAPTNRSALDTSARPRR